MSDKDLRLAMLDLNRQIDSKPKFTRHKKLQSRSVRIKSKVSKRLGYKYPSNCLKWSANQINRKAKQFGDSITKYSRQYRVDSNLIKAVITVESCFKIKAKSHANAHGLMQLIPATASRFGVRDSYNADQNIRGGVKYLKFLKERFNGDLKKVTAGYNAGEGAVDKYKGIPPYKETKNYVKNVLKIYAMLSPRKLGKLRKSVVVKKARVKAVYQPPKMGNKAGRHGWQYNRRLAPHLYKKK
ncbi:MAG: lytic transglycosylase domain-containing protein [Cocleimonas sp.]